MRPDFGVVVSPVIDWLLAQNGVNPQGLALIGRSFAGYLGRTRRHHRAAPRGAGV
ncbi:MAG: hypothetical protein LM550_02810 [Candidatus Contendobacter sp.]|nr:hypothetical protein [Gammaproteobacteria bacterium]MCC8992623.1 hypothetical protein [Candidatus Contendobacter sp.]